MSRKLSRLLSALIAAVLAITFLPVNSLVRADESNVYILYRYNNGSPDDALDNVLCRDISVDGVGATLPEDTTRVGVFVNGGTYEALPNDRFIIANNAVIDASDNLYISDLDVEKCRYGLSGKSSIITKDVTITCDNDAYSGGITADEILYYYNPNNGKFYSCYDYEITSDFDLKSDVFAKNVIIDPNVTLTINGKSVVNGAGIEHFKSSSLTVSDELKIKGTLTFGAIGDGRILNSTLYVESGGKFTFDGGEIVGVNGAKIYFYGDEANRQGLSFYEFDYENNLEFSHTSNAEYCESLGKWIRDYNEGYFQTYFDDYNYENEGTPAAFVKVNGKDIGTNQLTGFNAGEELDFTLISPRERKGETPIVRIYTYEDTIYPSLTKSGSDYTFSYTPSNNVGFTVDVYWSTFDALQTEEGNFLINIMAKGSLDYTVNYSGDVYTEPYYPKHKRYIVDDSYIENNDIVITVTLENGHKLDYISLFHEDYYTDEDAVAGNPDFIKVNDNTYQFTINKDNYSNYSEFWFYADDSSEYIPINRFTVNADVYVDSETNLPSAIVLVNGTLQKDYEEIYDFEVNTPVSFELTLPEWRQVDSNSPIVEIAQGDKTYSTSASGDNRIELSPVSGKAYTYSFTFTPSAVEGFKVNVYWSEYDKIQTRPGDIVLDIWSDESDSYSVINQATESAQAPNSYSIKYRYTQNAIPQDGIKIKLDTDSQKIRSVKIGTVDNLFIRDDLEIEDDYQMHFSDSELFTKDNAGNFYLTIPNEAGYYYMDFYYHGQTSVIDIEKGNYQVSYDSEYDGDTPVGYVEVNGRVIDADTDYPFEPGEELVFTLHAPTNRQGLEPIVRIFDDNTFYYSTEASGSEKLTVTNNQFTFTPTSDNGFRVVVLWCEYDGIWPNDDGSNFWVKTNAYDKGTIITSEYYLEAEDPYNAKEHKYLFSTSLFDNGGYAKFSFVPYANNDVACVTIDGVKYVESPNGCYPDALLMSSNPNFVKEDGIWTYRISEIDNEHIHYYIECSFTCEELPSQVVETSIALNDRIGINYYLDLPDEVANDENAYAQVNNVRYEIGAKNSDGLYPVRASVAVAEMNDELHLWICNGEGGVYTLCDKDGNDVTANGYTYSVAAYIAEAKASGNDQNLMLLLDRTNDFGKSAQDHFGYNTDLGTLSYSASDISGVASSDLNRYKSSVVVNNPDAGISSAGSSLALDTATVIRHYFKLAPGKTINDFRFTVNADPVKTTSTGKYTLKYNSSTSEVVLSINGIAAAELQNSYRVTVSDTANHITALEISNFSALSYAYTVLSKAEADASYNSRYSNLVTLMKAMYLYNRAAMQYFKVEEQDPVDDGPHDVAVGGVGDVQPEGAGVGEGSVPPEEGTAAVTDSASAVTIPTSGTPGSGVAGVRTGEEEDSSDSEQTPGQDAAPASAGNENQEDSNDPAGTEPVSPCMDDELADSEADSGSSSSAGEQPEEESTGAGTSGEGTTSEGTSSGGTSASVEKVGN